MLSYDQSQQISRREFARKPQTYFIVFACGLVFLMPNCLFSLRHLFQKYFWCLFGFVVCLIVNRSKQGLIHLFNMLGNIINFAKKRIHIKVWKLLFNLSILGILTFFCIYLLHFCPFHRTPPIWECFGNFLAHHKLNIKTFVRLKRRHQK